MSTPVSSETLSPRSLPDQPDLDHLRHQARDLHQANATPTLAAAFHQLAREYGFPSWPKLKSHVESLREIGQLKEAIDRNDFPRVRELMTLNPALHQAPLGYGKNGPLTWVAECRIPREAPGETRLAMARWMIENGSDVHQGGDGPLMRAALSDERVPMMELLIAHGADVNALWAGFYPILCAPCETLAPEALRCLLAHGANPDPNPPNYSGPLAMLLGTYSRNAAGRQACLEVFDQLGFALPDTAPMALHRGRVDLLEEHLHRDPVLLTRQFTEAEIYPPALGLNPGEGLCATPTIGGTLLHLAVEYDDLPTTTWLLDHGADPNVRAAVDAEGFGGHTPLFHTVITMGRKEDRLARLLLARGADPNVCTTLRKQLRDMGDPEKERMHEFQNVTPTEYARRFQEPGWVNEAALAALAQHRGK